MKSFLNACTLLLALACPVLLSACGGGGGGGSGGGAAVTATTSTPSAGASQAITAQGAASVGEFITFTISADRSTYSYTIVDSAFGLTGLTRSGTLTANADGTYTPSLDPGARVAFLPSGLVLAAVRENFGGVTRTAAFIGVPNPVTTFSAAAGTFNFVEYACLNAGGCGISAGTFRIDASGNWASCPGANYSPSCSNGQSGTLNNLGNGRFQVLNNGVSIGNALAYTAPNGQQVVVLDLNNGSANFGRGLLVGSVQRTLQAADVAGTYVSFNTQGSASVVTATSALTYTTSAGNAGTLALNQPLNGFVTATPNGGNPALALLAGKGLYGLVQQTASGPYFEVGIGL